ncbi:hypothetical protein BJF78_09725 [Pseudonocardia sp. CNS-139]|nr:hypothetical protein BJF78_09725 [Pseudonocardia sp. CNS-139]
MPGLLARSSPAARARSSASGASGARIEPGVPSSEPSDGCPIGRPGTSGRSTGIRPGPYETSSSSTWAAGTSHGPAPNASGAPLSRSTSPPARSVTVSPSTVTVSVPPLRPTVTTCQSPSWTTAGCRTSARWPPPCSCANTCPSRVRTSSPLPSPHVSRLLSTCSTGPPSPPNRAANRRVNGPVPKLPSLGSVAARWPSPPSANASSSPSPVRPAP